jgi:SPP1 family phage portal protein
VRTLVTVEQIKDAIAKHKLELPRYQKLYDYYVGSHKILNRKLPDPTKPNNKMVTSYPTIIIDTVVGYFASKPLSYLSASNDEDFLNELKRIFYLNDEEDTNAETVKNFSIFGKTFNLHYMDEQGNLRFKHYSPLEMHVEKDNSGIVKYAIRYWTEEVGKEKILKVEAYDSEGIYNFLGDNFTLESQKEHYFGETPIVTFQNNAEEQGDFEQLVPMIDSLETMLSDTSNEIESWVNAYLVLGGMSGTTSEDLAKMRQDGALLLDDVDQAKFLTKDVNPDFQQNFFETVDKLLHKFSGIPDLTSEAFSSNLSGTALGFKLYNMESRAANKERKMEKALRKRIRFICTILNKQGKEYNPYDIRFNFVRNIPQNKAEISDMIVKLSPHVDQKTLLALHPDITDVDLVLKRIKEQSDTMNLDNIKHVSEQNYE